MRRTDKVRLGMVFVLLVLLMAPVAGWARVFNYTRPYYHFLPIEMQFANEAGNPIGRSSNVVMYGGQTKNFFVDVVDVSGNGKIDIRDFKVYEKRYTVSLDINISGDTIASDSSQVVSLDVPIPPDLGSDADKLIGLVDDALKSYLSGLFETALQNSFSGVGFFLVTASTENLLDVTFDVSNLAFFGSPRDPRITPPDPLPSRVLRSRVTARQQLGDRGSSYNEQSALLKYTIYWGQRAALDEDEERKKLLTRAETSQMNILIRPTDQGGGNGDNGGGSCNALALGAVVLLAPGLFLLRRGKTQAEG